MLIFENWKKIFVFLVSVFAIVFVIPNFSSNNFRDNVLPNFINLGEIRLGLDLQGGSYLLLKVQAEALQVDRLNNIASEVRMKLRQSDPKIGYKNISVENNSLNFELINSNNYERAVGLIREIDNSLIIEGEEDLFINIMLSEIQIKENEDYAILQSIEIIRRRVNEVGTNEPIISRQGDDQILVHCPGLNDPEKI
jgi:Preprotein translocase subunit SecD